MDKQKIVGMMIGVIVLAGGIGYMIGISSKSGVLGSSDSALQAKLDEVKKMFPVMPDSNFVYGQVKSVSGNVITLNTPKTNPFDESPTVRQVTVTSATKIIRNENKSPATVQAEQKAYMDKMSTWKPGSTGTLPIPPTPFTEKNISISDIKVGDQLNVEAATKIRMLEKFTAVKINVQMSASAPAPIALPAATVPPAATVVPPAAR